MAATCGCGRIFVANLEEVGQTNCFGDLEGRKNHPELFPIAINEDFNVDHLYFLYDLVNEAPSAQGGATSPG